MIRNLTEIEAVRDEGTVVVFSAFDVDDQQHIDFAVDHRPARALEGLDELDVVQVYVADWQLLSVGGEPVL